MNTDETFVTETEINLTEGVPLSFSSLTLGLKDFIPRTNCLLDRRQKTWKGWVNCLRGGRRSEF